MIHLQINKLTKIRKKKLGNLLVQRKIKYKKIDPYQRIKENKIWLMNKIAKSKSSKKDQF